MTRTPHPGRTHRPRPGLRSLPTLQRWGLAGTLAALIVVLSVMREPPIPTQPAGLIGMEHSADKLAHLAGYFLLSLAIAFAMTTTERGARRAAWTAFLAASLFGALMEALQGLLPYRNGDALDAAANAAGAAMAAILWTLWGAPLAAPRAAP